MNACHLWFVDEIETSAAPVFWLRAPSLRDLNNLKVKGEKKKEKQQEEEILYIKYLCVLNGGLSVVGKKKIPAREKWKFIEA